MNIGGSAQSKVDYACAYSFVRDPIDNDESAEPTVIVIRFEGRGPVGADVHHSDLIEPQALRSQVRACVGVQLVLDFADRSADLLGVKLRSNTA